MKHYPKTFSGRRASQSEYELKSFIELLNKHEVKRYLEIGAREGDTFHEIVSLVPSIEIAVAVDLPGGLWGKSTTQEVLKKAVHNLFFKGRNVTCIFGDSHSFEIIEKIKAFGEFDAIFIDGDHTLEGVRSDWENYASLAPIIAFHDIVGLGQYEKIHNNEVQVPILWEELKTQHKHVEFIGQDSKMGIGVIFK